MRPLLSPTTTALTDSPTHKHSMVLCRLPPSALRHSMVLCRLPPSALRPNAILSSTLRSARAGVDCAPVHAPGRLNLQTQVMTLRLTLPAVLWRGMPLPGPYWVTYRGEEKLL